MPAQRWQSGIQQFFRAIGESDDELMNSFMSSVLARFQDKDNNSSEQQKDDKNEAQKFPDVLPILPLRGVVVYPNSAVPLTVGQARSIRLVDDVVGGDKLVGLVAALNPDQETPGPNELHKFGTIATVHRLLRAPDGTVRLLVQGMARFRLGEFVTEEPYLKAHIHLAPESDETNIETDALARNARDQFQQITQMIPSFPDELVNSITSLEDPLQTANTIANFQRIDLKDAQEILELDSVYDKLKKLIGLLVREAEVLTIGQKIQNEARGEIEKVQREYFLRE
ncbi:MAG: LON peptidase substrate-binding domain-containing protein, partial [Anaerolineales bacterium]|nr:LON peptidase substrate-binding domain-containing protein [Anaerolineales bacterium]